MSGSPKYTVVTANEQRSQQAERERQTRERQRREERERRAQAALRRLRQLADQRLQALLVHGGQLADRARTLGRETVLVGLCSELDALRVQVGSANDRARLDVAVQRGEILMARLTNLDLELAGRAAEYTGRRLEGMRELVESIDIADRRRFDRAGVDEVDRLLSLAYQSSGRDPGSGAAEGFAALTARIDQHLVAVRAGQARQLAHKQSLAADIDLLDFRLNGLVADANDAGVTLPDEGPARESMRSLRTAVEQDRIDEATDLAAQINKALARTEGRLDSLINRFTERRSILASIVDALPGLGFGVVADSLRESADGTLTICAQRHSGETVAVVVHEGENASHEVLYTSSDEQQCHRLADLATELSTATEREGFDAGAVMWDHDTGRKPPRAARRQGLADRALRSHGAGA